MATQQKIKNTIDIDGTRSTNDNNNEPITTNNGTRVNGAYRHTDRNMKESHARNTLLFKRIICRIIDNIVISTNNTNNEPITTNNGTNNKRKHHYPGPNECIVYWNFDDNSIHNVHQFSDLIPILKEKICDKIGSKPVHFRIYSSWTNITQPLQDAFDINGINHMHISCNYAESVNKRILIDVMLQLYELEKYKQSKCIALISNDEALSHLLSKIHKEPTISHSIYISFESINHNSNFVHNVDFVVHHPLGNNQRKRKHSDDDHKQQNKAKKRKLNSVQPITVTFENGQYHYDKFEMQINPNLWVKKLRLKLKLMIPTALSPIVYCNALQLKNDKARLPFYGVGHGSIIHWCLKNAIHISFREFGTNDNITLHIAPNELVSSVYQRFTRYLKQNKICFRKLMILSPNGQHIPISNVFKKKTQKKTKKKQKKQKKINAVKNRWRGRFVKDYGIKDGVTLIWCTEVHCVDLKVMSVMTHHVYTFRVNASSTVKMLKEKVTKVLKMLSNEYLGKRCHGNAFLLYYNGNTFDHKDYIVECGILNGHTLMVCKSTLPKYMKDKAMKMSKTPRFMGIIVNEESENKLKNEENDDDDDDSDVVILENPRINNPPKEQENTMDVVDESVSDVIVMDESNIQSTDQASENSMDGIRASWCVNSVCMIYSRSKDKWVNGTIVKIETIDNEEWLTVHYDTKCKEIKRDCEHIKPIPNGEALAVNCEHIYSEALAVIDTLHMPQLEDDSDMSLYDSELENEKMNGNTNDAVSSTITL